MMTTINFKIDMQTKKDFEQFTNNIGMSMSTLINIFIKKTLQEQEVPFKLGLSTEQQDRISRSLRFANNAGVLSDFASRFGIKNEEDVDRWFTEERRKQRRERALRK